MIKNVIVLGAGTAGLMAALALKGKIPQLDVRVVRSPDIGVIGVGESTTAQFPPFLFEYLGLSRKRFYAVARPTWKMGIHFLWGPRPAFDFPFDFQLDGQWSELSRPNGYYCEESFENVSLSTALMGQGKAFVRQENGAPSIGDFAAFHLFNPALVRSLEEFSVERGIEFVDAKVSGATLCERGVKAVVLEDGRHLEADLFVDASGFRSELLGKALGTPFVPYDNALFCDRCVVGSWERGPGPDGDFLYPYTVAETMEAGWCWRIDHEHAVNRGYVYSSRFLSDEAAREEFLKKNPKAKTWDHVVKFRSGRRERGWVKNVFAIGNASGFVEPLEATSLMVATTQIQAMVEMLERSQLDPGPRMLELYNSIFAEMWDYIRNFLALHYKFNTRIPSKFWTTCLNEVDVSPSQPLLDFYAENGPTGLGRHLLTSTLGAKTQFGIEGYLVMLVGQKVPYEVRHTIPPAEMAIFRQYCETNRRRAEGGMTVAEALKYVHHPGWTWNGDGKT